jgi:spermidine synthase
MNKLHKLLLFIMFCLSGFCGLAYQIVWLRKAFAVFGVITPVISVVISVFMLGLFFGSWAGGRWIKTITGKLSISAIYLYAAAELMIGIGGISVPYLFLFGDQFLLPMGNTGSFTYLLFSGLLIAIVMVPWCIFMGTTYPFMMAFLEEHYPEEKNGFSFLYLANVIGAMTGTLFTALVLIEIFGFQNTLFIAACMNFTVALLAVLLGVSFGKKHLSSAFEASEESGKKHQTGASLEQPSIHYLTKTILFITGFCAMGMEVIWARSFTPALGTFIYSFAALLFTYLLATGIGSYFYRRRRDTHLTPGTSLIVAMLAVSAFLPVVFTDWRVPFFSKLPVSSIFPFCFLLGYLTPKLIDEYSGGDPDRAGKAYAINIAGCVLGPLVASYLLLPFFGSRVSIIILTLPVLWLFIKHWDALRTTPIWRAILSPLLVVIIFCSIFISISFEEGFKKVNGVIRHDYAATVVSYGSGFKKGLLVNGIGMTHFSPIMKDMAHMPLAFLNHKPQSALMICLGMGTTLRSLASWGIDVTVVELVPSVKEAFGYYYADADRVLSEPNVRIIIDDGRRYLRRTEKKYDVITIDPPPPVEAAGSSLLYSEEFYSLIQKKLKPDGILQQWLPEVYDLDIMDAVTTSITHSFRYVLMYRVNNMGYHYLASMSPIHIPTAAEAISKMPEAARKDRLEWELNTETKLIEIWNELLEGKINPALFKMSSDKSITDDKPVNEYYLIRSLKKMNFKSFVSWITNFSKRKNRLFYFGDTPPSDIAYVAEAFLEKGTIYGMHGQYQQAIINFSKAIELNPNYAMAYNNRGYAYNRLGHYQLAIKDFNKVISLKSDYANAYNNRGISYTSLGQYMRAIEDYNEAIRLNQNNANAFGNRGVNYFNQDNKILGCRDVQKACSLGNCKYLEIAKSKGFCR